MRMPDGRHRAAVDHRFDVGAGKVDDLHLRHVIGHDKSRMDPHRVFRYRWLGHEPPRRRRPWQRCRVNDVAGPDEEVLHGDTEAGDLAERGDSHRFDAFDDDFLLRHVVLTLDQSEPRIDLCDAVTGVVGLPFQLSPTHPQHPAKLSGVNAVAQEFADLPQREAQLLEGDDPVEVAELADLIPTVAGPLVQMRGAEQAQIVVRCKTLARTAPPHPTSVHRLTQV